MFFTSPLKTNLSANVFSWYENENKALRRAVGVGSGIKCIQKEKRTDPIESYERK